MNNPILCLFEDEVASGFYPLTATRHVGDLLVGTRLLSERAASYFPNYSLRIIGRRQIEEHASKSAVLSRGPAATDAASELVLFLNARLSVTSAVVESLDLSRSWIVVEGDTVVAASIFVQDLDRLFPEQKPGERPRFELLTDYERLSIPQPTLYRWIWELLDANAGVIAEDALDTERFSLIGPVHGVHVVHPEGVRVAGDIKIAPGCVLDASAGPIVFGQGVTVMPNSFLAGPLFIGNNATIKAGARIYGGTSIGPWCKIGGEVEDSIVLGYSNKQHEGFLGHSYLGQWVNLGADTNTSDLKNNYGPISISLEGHPVETGRMFLGSLIGDHVKTAINTMLNTGSVIGTMSNLFGSGFCPKEVPPFSWGGSDGFARYRLDAAIGLAERVMARRNVVFTERDRTLIEFLHNELQPDDHA